MKVTTICCVFPKSGIFFLVEFIFKETPRNGTLPYQGQNAFC